MKAAIATVAVLATTAFAAADSVTMRYLNAGAGRAVNIEVDGEQYRVHAGQLNHEVMTSTGPRAPRVGALVTYCVDVTEWVSQNTLAYDVKDLTDAPVGSGNDGMAQHKADAVARLYTFANGQQFTGNRNYAAAFQIAIWEVIADLDTDSSTLDVNSGDFRAWSINGGTANFLTTLLAAATDQSVAIDRRVLALTNDGAQDQMYQVVIPLPTAGAMAAVGLLGAGFITRRRRA